VGDIASIPQDESNVSICDEVKKLQREVRELKGWKESAMIVLAEWEQVWEAAGKPGRLGDSKAGAVREHLAVAVKKTTNTPEPEEVQDAQGGCRQQACAAPRYLVALHGGTVLRLEAGARSHECAYDQLLALLARCEVLYRGEWLRGERGINGAAMEDSAIAAELVPNAQADL
jgi:hypothetical protein